MNVMLDHECCELLMALTERSKLYNQYPGDGRIADVETKFTLQERMLC